MRLSVVGQRPVDPSRHWSRAPSSAMPSRIARAGRCYVAWPNDRLTRQSQADAGSATRVVLGMERLEAFLGHMGVDLRGGQVTVTEQELDDAKIGAVID